MQWPEFSAGIRRQYYFYTLASPQHIILAKMAYNAVVSGGDVRSGTTFYIATQGYPVEDDASFLLAMLLGALAFASTFSMISAVASRAANNGTLTAILSFPILLPVMRILIRVKPAGADRTEPGHECTGSALFSCTEHLHCGVGIDIISYLWRD